MKLSNKGMRISMLALMAGSVLMLSIPCAEPAYAQTATAPGSQAARVDTSNSGSAIRVAPGGSLPISVKLSNFGGVSRVDVLVIYSILNAAGNEIASTTETVAVETTASFVKTVGIPFDAPPGTYTAKTSAIYAGQLVPATSQFSFTVEVKILGLFLSDFYLYGGITIVISLCMLLLSNILIRRHQRGRLTSFDYSDIPHNERTFYEIVSDTIMAMRQRVGDDALDIASHVDGLTIDRETGRVLGLTKSPGKVIARLVSDYEERLGKKVSFSFRKE